MSFRLPVFLYRLYDAKGALLYVGITENVGIRMRGHARTKPWWRAVARLAVETHPDRETADTAEWAAILSERPVHNIAKRKKPKPPGVATQPRPPEKPPTPRGVVQHPSGALTLHDGAGRAATMGRIPMTVRDRTAARHALGPDFYKLLTEWEKTRA